MTIDHPSLLGDAALVEAIERMRTEERRISRHRNALHRRIDFLRSGGYAHLDHSAGQLSKLEVEEKEVSAARRELHARLDAALAEQHSRNARHLSSING